MPVKQERLSETLAFRVTPAVYQYLNDLAAKDRRKLSEVATALLERGIAAFKRDGRLFEPEKDEYKRVPIQHEAPARKRS